ncbi:hypothetical protein BER93_09550 [Xanthomonas fragariae]|nr:hypothetical protein BER93_09550 [Xanthomonas fragariae]
MDGACEGGTRLEVMHRVHDQAVVHDARRLEWQPARSVHWDLVERLWPADATSAAAPAFAQ